MHLENIFCVVLGIECNYANCSWSQWMILVEVPDVHHHRPSPAL